MDRERLPCVRGAGSPKARLRGCIHIGMLQSLSLCCAQPASKVAPRPALAKNSPLDCFLNASRPLHKGAKGLRSNVLSETSLYNQCCRAVSTDSAARWSRLESCLSFLYYYITSLTTLTGIDPTGQGLCCRSLLKKGRSFDLPFFKDARRALVWGRTEPLFGLKRRSPPGSWLGRAGVTLRALP